MSGKRESDLYGKGDETGLGLMSRADAARFLHLSPATLATWASRGKEGAPPMRKHGGRVVYARDDLLRWSQEQMIR
jgi:hypothetical protein